MWYIRDNSRVAEQLKTQELRKLGENLRETSENYNLAASLPLKIKTLLMLANNA